MFLAAHNGFSNTGEPGSESDGQDKYRLRCGGGGATTSELLVFEPVTAAWPVPSHAFVTKLRITPVTARARLSDKEAPGREAGRCRPTPRPRPRVRPRFHGSQQGRAAHQTGLEAGLVEPAVCTASGPSGPSGPLRPPAPRPQQRERGRARPSQFPVHRGGRQAGGEGLIGE